MRQNGKKLGERMMKERKGKEYSIQKNRRPKNTRKDWSMVVEQQGG